MDFAEPVSGQCHAVRMVANINHDLASFDYIDNLFSTGTKDMLPTFSMPYSDRRVTIDCLSIHTTSSVMGAQPLMKTLSPGRIPG